LKSYGKKGEDVVNKNYAAVDRGGEYNQLTVDPAWANLPDDEEVVNNDPAFINEVVRPITELSHPTSGSLHPSVLRHSKRTDG